MAVTVMLPSCLRRLADGRKIVQVDGRSVGEVLDTLVSQYPSLRPHLFRDTGQLRETVSVFVDDKTEARFDRGIGTPVDGESVHIVPTMAGGAA